MKRIKRLIAVMTLCLCFLGLTACNGVGDEAARAKDDISRDISEGVSDMTRDRGYDTLEDN